MPIRSIPQRSFEYGAVRPDMIERTDSEVRASSLQTAENVVITAVGGLKQRPGFEALSPAPGASDYREIVVGDGLRYAVMLSAGKLQVKDYDGVTVVEFAAPWTEDDLATLYVSSERENTLIGNQSIAPQLLNYNAGVWSFGQMGYAGGSGAAISQPYWPFNPGISITPSAREGSITIIASSPVFSSGYVGQRIRYHDREILVTGYTNTTTITGTVQQTLPPTFEIEVNDASGFLVGEFITGESSAANGLIARIDLANNLVYAIVTKNFEGFKASETIVGPSHTTDSTATAPVEVAPEASEFWDEPMFSPVRGYPGHATVHQGRRIFTNIPEVPPAIVLSSLRDKADFKVGDNDADAIVDVFDADQGPRHLYAVSAEDLIILSDKGAYYQLTRDGSAVTPASFRPIKFDTVGAAQVQPVQVNDGVAFVDKGGQSIMAAFLRGDQYRAWTVDILSELHEHLFVTPRFLGSTEGDDERSERYIFVVNSDGTAVYGRWKRQGGEEKIGWVLWRTEGTFVAMTSVLGRISAIVDRDVGGTTARWLERAREGLYLDGAVYLSGIVSGGGLDGLADPPITDEDGDALLTESGAEITTGGFDLSPLLGETACLWQNARYEGDYAITSEGQITSPPTFASDAVFGRKFEVTLKPWRPEFQDADEVGFQVQLWGETCLSLKDTLNVAVNGEKILEPYDSADDVDLSPTTFTGRVYATHADVEGGNNIASITRGNPGPFYLLAMYYAVEV